MVKMLKTLITVLHGNSVGQIWQMKTVKQNIMFYVFHLQDLFGVSHDTP
jgi:hypothetical protein